MPKNLVFVTVLEMIANDRKWFLNLILSKYFFNTKFLPYYVLDSSPRKLTDTSIAQKELINSEFKIPCLYFTVQYDMAVIAFLAFQTLKIQQNPQAPKSLTSALV